MSLLPECPCCMGLMTSRPSTLSSACFCGYPAVVTWDHAEAKRLSDENRAQFLVRRDLDHAEKMGRVA